MRKRIFSILACLTLCLLLLPAITQRAEATVYDHIRYFGIQVQPNAKDGSLTITHNFEWEAVQELPYGQELKIGIPNGSIRDVTPLTDNIERMDYDNSYMYIYLTDAYDAGDVFEFSYSWTQEYMYTLGEDGSVNYEYTPGWFDEISIDRMQLSWYNPAGVTAQSMTVSHTGGEWNKDGNTYVGTDLPYGARITLTAVYTDWPNELFFENSAGNLPSEYNPDGGGDWGNDWNDDWEDAIFDAVFSIVGFIVFVTVIVVVICLVKNDGYSGGFGTHYVFVHGLWYPAGADGHPRPGSVGTKTRPHPPRSSSSGGFGGGGFGGGSRGGGFGGGGFGGGGGHCACASSCACACACACAGGGRAGCSAKNLYGAVHLSEELTEELQQ